MEIRDIKLSDIRPYEANAKLHSDEQVEAIANSIKEFGTVQPLVLDADNVIVIGHGRYAALKKLKRKTAPCYFADDLTPEQIKALRLVDNTTNVMTGFNMDIFSDEFSSIFDLDMSLFGLTEPEQPKKKQNERVRTVNTYNLPYFDPSRASGKYQMPTLDGVEYIPDKLVGFNYVLSSDDYRVGVHFFIDDYQFERVWNSPEKYIDKLISYDCVLTPDFSLYTEMPLANKIWNVYRSRLIGQVLQDTGAIVIPTVSWAEPETFEFCFDGLPKNSTLAISTIGVKQDPKAFEIWKVGVDELMKRLEPSALLIYGGKVDYDYGDTEVFYYANEVTERMKGE